MIFSRVLICFKMVVVRMCVCGMFLFSLLGISILLYTYVVKCFRLFFQSFLGSFWRRALLIFLLKTRARL